jgi:hypothetical protein
MKGRYEKKMWHDAPHFEGYHEYILPTTIQIREGVKFQEKASRYP